MLVARDEVMLDLSKEPMMLITFVHETATLVEQNDPSSLTTRGTVIVPVPIRLTAYSKKLTRCGQLGA